MTKKILYVIGNGFDIHHTIRSRYKHFKEYVETKDPDLFEAIEKYFPNDSDWSDFETTLAYLDTDELVENASVYLMSYADDNWRDSANHDYQYELGKIITLVTEKLKERFTEWVLQIAIPAEAYEHKLAMPAGIKYINFNYTPTLEKIYGIKEGEILYIHHKAVNIESNLILGHGRNPKEMKSMNDGATLEDQDVRITEGNKLLDDYFAENYKPTKRIIKDNKEFFKSLKDIDEVHVLGHSISSVDIRYFEEIKKHISAKKVEWKVSYYTNKERIEHEEVLIEIGIKKELLHFDRLKNLYSSQLSLF